MEKVIIICQYYPPNEITAAARPFSWFENFTKFGIYPIVFCKNDLNKEKYHIEKNELGEIHYIKYDDHYLLKKVNTTKNSIIRKFYVFLNLVLENDIRIHHSKYMEPYIESYIANNNIHKLVVTGNPFALFGLANKLSLKFHLKWIADYRDDWTSDSVISNNFFIKILKKIDIFREKKYLNSCSFFTTVSDYYILKIRKVINKDGFLIENGYLENTNSTNRVSYNSKLEILFLGTIYETQKIKIITDAIDLLSVEKKLTLQFTFLGTHTSGKHYENLKKYILQGIVNFKNKVSKKEANFILESADLLLALSHTSKQGNILKGIPSSKLYDYIKSKKQILVCPSDKDIVEKKLTETRQGIFCENAKQLAKVLEEKIKEKEIFGYIPNINIPEKIYYQNSRKYQAEKMAKLILDL